MDESILGALRQARETKILFADLDDTLLTSDKKISDKTRDKILQMLAAGHHFVLASGRPINSILAVLEQLDIVEGADKRTGGIYATAYNGAMLYDCIRREPLEGYEIAVETAQRLFDMAAACGLHIQTYTDTHIVSIAEDKELEFYTKSVALPHIVSTRLAEALPHAPYKLIAIDLEGRERLEAFRDAVEASDMGEEIICAFSNAQYLEFYNREAGKGNALIKLCRALNLLVANAVAVGDEENDASMIKAAGIGVAMANGNPILQECADYVTRNDNNHDGIVEVIDRFIL
ncbi:MAG: Cof-type HAD-IIB family hydrolase [Roseburia sp.]|nr:Cof-type HAD-IIB family hydrolase [Roseburia sp.]